MKKNSRQTSASKKKRQTSNMKNVIQDIDVNSEKSKINLDFETAMLEMSFDNLAGLMKTFGIPSPHAKKIKQQAKLISMFNQKMIEGGHPEQVINMGEKILPWILRISTAEMFIEPIGKWLIEMADKRKENSGIAEKKKSMRE